MIAYLCRATGKEPQAGDERMYDPHSIDIVIPSFRLHEHVLMAIIALPKPPDFQVNTYIVADNPQVVVPLRLQELHESGAITLLINSSNVGVSATRNKGIRAGNSKWILLLDDDIQPQSDLLIAYAQAIQQEANAIGFVGVTYFPEPVNSSTKALTINGSVDHFSAASRYSTLPWAPTANIMLNRQKLGDELFDPALTKSGEDIDFLVRNYLYFNEKYIGVPHAVVFHPWWDNGRTQTRRMVRYGEGASQIARKEPVKNYTYHDFLNTSESLLLLLLLLPMAVLAGEVRIIACYLTALILAEFMTNLLKAVLVGKTWSLPVAFQLMWIKNCYEFGYLTNALSQGHINGFAERIEMGFVKPHPSSFRLNRWKIIKSLVLIVLLVLFWFITT
ncbi:glycosyltransferase family 2 protein [Spirosoma sp. KNUC1025]|uniref:glycosyltransferase family 2 protein n=1 Tax=Spirosoma sp. KNUC1025 TaxID=2894082 RepID=UPI003864A468|nr:glycosyltransferase [Spirosoma sp. KNUC1025]